MKRMIHHLISIAIISGLLSPSLCWAKPKVLFIGFLNTETVSEDLSLVLSNYLQSLLIKGKEFTLVDYEALTGTWRRNTKKYREKGITNNLQRLGKMSGVSHMLIGHLARLGDEYTLSLKLLKLPDATVQRCVTITSVPELGALRTAVAKLMLSLTDQCDTIPDTALELEHGEQKSSQRHTTKTLQLQSNYGIIAVNAAPWASVYLDGEYYSLTPVSLDEVPPGDHLLQLINPDYCKYEATITMLPGKKVKVHHTFTQKRYAVVQVNVIPWSSVFIDGHYVGETPLHTRLSPGDYMITLTHPDFAPITLTITLNKGETRKVFYNLN